MVDNKLLKNGAVLFAVLALLHVVFYGVPTVLAVLKLVGVSLLGAWALPKVYDYLKSKL